MAGIDQGLRRRILRAGVTPLEMNEKAVFAVVVRGRDRLAYNRDDSRTGPCLCSPASSCSSQSANEATSWSAMIVSLSRPAFAISAITTPICAPGLAEPVTCGRSRS